MIKTVTLTGGEQKVSGLEKSNTLVINNSPEPVYASSRPNVRAYEDDVIEIPAGARDTVVGTNGTVYLSGSGRVELRGVEYINFNQPSLSAGGGGINVETDVKIIEKRIVPTIDEVSRLLDDIYS